jgi:hypothetical protein
MAKEKGQNDKQRSIKHYTKNQRSSNANPRKRSIGNSGTQRGITGPAPQETPVVFQYYDTNII